MEGYGARTSMISNRFAAGKPTLGFKGCGAAADAYMILQYMALMCPPDAFVIKPHPTKPSSPCPRPLESQHSLSPNVDSATI